MNYKIIADSSADLSALSGCSFSSVPLKIITAHKEYVDDAALDVSQMIDDLRKYKGVSRSSCPNAQDWLTAFGDSEAIFCVTITSGLSGSYNSACLALNDYLEAYPHRKGLVIDSLSVGPESSLITEKLCQLINEGAEFEDICNTITEYKKTTHLIFCLDSLRNLANNGRISPAVAKIAGRLGIRIVGKAGDEGTLEITDKARGADKALATIYKNMKSSGYSGGRVHIHHCENPEAAEVIVNMVKGDYPEAEITVRQTRGLCSFYAESKGLLIGFEGDSK